MYRQNIFTVLLYIEIRRGAKNCTMENMAEYKIKVLLQTKEKKNFY